MSTRADKWVGTAEGWRDWVLAMAQIRQRINKRDFRFCIKLFLKVSNLFCIW